jgi:elongation factor P
MIDINDLRKGVIFEVDNNLWKVLDYHHNKTGRGNATIRVKVVNLRNGTQREMTFQSGFRVQDVRLDYHNVQYLYNDGHLYYFMDQETFEQQAVSSEVLGDSKYFLKDMMEAKLTFYQGEALDVELPLTVDLLITEAEIAVRGDTATGVTKKVMTETGLQVQVPNFVNQGDTIRVDTRDGSYLTRV